MKRFNELLEEYSFTGVIENALDDFGLTNALENEDLLVDDDTITVTEDIFLPANFSSLRWHVIDHCANEGLSADGIEQLKLALSNIESQIGRDGGKAVQYTGVSPEGLNLILVKSPDVKQDHGYHQASVVFGKKTISWGFKQLKRNASADPGNTPAGSPQVPVTDKPEPAKAGQSPSGGMHGPQEEPGKEPLENTTVEQAPMYKIGEREIIVERDDKYKHKYNTTGFMFKAADGKPLSQNEVLQFIANEKKKGNQEFIDAFPVTRIKEENRNKPPAISYTIGGSKPRHMGYVFDPNWNKKKEEKDSYIGVKVNLPGMVTASSGIKIHTRPSPGAKDPASATYSRGSAITILARGNEQNQGWVLIRTGDGKTGWIQEDYVMPTAPGQRERMHYVQKGETLEGIIKSSGLYKGFNYETGNDRRTIAAAIYAVNKGHAGIYLNTKDIEVDIFKLLYDPYFEPNRQIYQAIKVKEGQYIELPGKEQIELLKQSGQVGTRPDWMNTAIGTGKGILGFIEGVGIGFAEAAVDTVTGIWDMISGIFTGELFSQAWDMIKQLWDAGWEGVWEMIKGFWNSTVDSFQAAWNNPNPEQKWMFFGKIVGNILFEVLATILLGGSNLLAKFPKAMKVVKLVQDAMPNVPPAVKKKIDDVAKMKNAVKKKIDEVFSRKSSKAKQLEADVDDAAKSRLNKEAAEEVKKDMKEDDPEFAAKLAALAAAKVIIEGADMVDMPIPALMVELEFLEALDEVDDFRHEPLDLTAPIHEIYMIGSKYFAGKVIVDNSLKSRIKKELEDAINYQKKIGVIPANAIVDVRLGEIANEIFNVVTKIRSKTYRLGDKSLIFDQQSLAHILARHHPKYWVGKATESQSWWPSGISPQGIMNKLDELFENKEFRIKLAEIAAKPTGSFQILHNGIQYTVGAKNGRILQFFPVN